MIDKIPSKRNPDLSGHIKADKVIINWQNNRTGEIKRDARNKHQDPKLLRIPLNGISKKSEAQYRLYEKGNFGQHYVSNTKWIEVNEGISIT